MEKAYKQDRAFAPSETFNNDGNGHMKIDEHMAESKLDSAGLAGKRAGLEMGSERRLRIEKRLKLKLDARFSILVSGSETNNR